MGSVFEIASRPSQFALEKNAKTQSKEDVSDTYHLAYASQAEWDDVREEREP